MAGETVAAHMLGLINQVGHGAKRFEIPVGAEVSDKHEALFGLFLNPKNPRETLIAGVGKKSLDVNIQELTREIVTITPPSEWSSEVEDSHAEAFKELAAAVGSPYAVLSARRGTNGHEFTLYCLDGLAPTGVLYQFQEKVREQK